VSNIHYSIFPDYIHQILNRTVKKPLLITLFILVLIVTGYFGYKHFLSKPKLTLWDLVPTETVLVYETSDCKSCLQDLKNSPVVQIIKAASLKNQRGDSLSALQNLILSFQEPTLVSLHVTKKDEFDFAYYVYNTPSFQQKIDLLSDQFVGLKGLKSTTREYQTIPIQEITYQGMTFSSALIDNIWVGSYSPILVEDVIRTYKSDDSNSFRDIISSVYQLPRIKNDGGNLYVHLRNLSQWFSIFTKEDSNFLIDHFGHSSLLDAKVGNNKLELNGFSYHPLDKKEFFLSAFQEQNPVEFNLRNIISNRTLIVNDFGVSDGKRFFTRLNALSKNPYNDTLKTITSTLDFNAQRLFDEFSGEISVCHLESRKESLTKILLVNDAKNSSEWFKQFSSISKALSTDSVFIDRYSGYDIYEMPITSFPEKLFYPLVTGFSSSYYTMIGNTMCIGDNMEELKKFLDDVDQENTWGKSVAQNKFLESTLLESSVSIFINSSRIWHLLSLNLQPKWQTFLEENKAAFNRLGMGAIQFSHLNDTYYTNISWSYGEPKQEEKRESSDRYITNFNSGVAHFSIAQSHTDNSREVLIQDSLKNLSLVSNAGKILWQLPLPGFIAGEMHQIDFFNNGKLQYFFATPGSLHVVDRLGNYVKPFPVAIKEQQIDHVSIIDYDHSKKYRFLVASAEGKLWMFDKEGNNLEGWQPRTVDEKLITSVNHHRIHGRDYLVAVRKDGLVYLMNRRGELAKNFPLDLNARLEGDYFLEIGKKASDTYFTVVSVDGIKYKFNLQGKLVSQDAFVKTSAEAKFALVSEKKFKSFLVVRREEKMFTVFDESSNEIINSDYIGNNPVDVSYYSFGNGKDYIVVSDLSQDLSFIYDRKGKLVSPIPVDSQILKVFPAEGEKVKVYFVDDKNVTIGELP
jgi:hypothetical protein